MEKLKQSYETLLRFSFLAQDEEQFSNEPDYSKDQLQNFYATTKLGQISPESNHSNNSNHKNDKITENETNNNNHINRDVSGDDAYGNEQLPERKNSSSSK